MILPFFFPERKIREFDQDLANFVSSFNFNIGLLDRPEPVILDLYLVKFAFGFSVKLNVVSIIGMILGIYIMKWSGGK
jgi:hypothetical protein